MKTRGIQRVRRIATRKVQSRRFVGKATGAFGPRARTGYEVRATRYASRHASHSEMYTKCRLHYYSKHARTLYYAHMSYSCIKLVGLTDRFSSHRVSIYLICHCLRRSFFFLRNIQRITQ